jgi:hypothetical protein
MKRALPSLPSVPGRRRSRRSRALAAGTKAVKGGTNAVKGSPALKAVRGATHPARRDARRTRATIALPLVSLGAFVMFLRKRLKARREGTLAGAVDAPPAVNETPRPAAEDPSPANPETDLPAAPNGSPNTEESRKTAKAAVADVDGPNEGAPGHQPS